MTELLELIQEQGVIRRQNRVEDVADCLPYKGTAKRIEEMDAAVAAQFRREWRQSRSN